MTKPAAGSKMATSGPCWKWRRTSDEYFLMSKFDYGEDNNFEFYKETVCERDLQDGA